MQVFRTSRGQALPAVEESSRGQSADPALQEAVNDFFNQEPLGEEAPVVPSNPFDILTSSAPPAPGTESLTGAPSASQFAPSRVITLEQWLMANPEGRFYIRLYKEKMETILQNRFIRRRDQLQQALNSGGMRPHEARVVQQVLQQIEGAIIKMNQEIQKAESRIHELDQVYFREKIILDDLNGDGYIGDPTSEDYYIKAVHPNGTETILEKDGKTVAVNPTLDPMYQPALISTESVSLIERNRHGARSPGVYGFDEILEIKPTDANAFEGTLGALIDVTAGEGFWVEADAQGEPLKDKDPIRGEWHYKPKPLEVVTREEDGKQMYGQTPPTDEERGRWVFVKVTDLEISSETVRRDGEEIDGGLAHYVFKDAKGNPVMRLRFDGVETLSHHPLVTDGTNYIAATSVGIAVNAGKVRNSEGEEIISKHSGRMSYINIDAHNYHSTGWFSTGSDQDAFIEELGLPADFYGGLEDLSSQEREAESAEGVMLRSNRERAVQAADDTLYAPFFGRGMEGTDMGNRLQDSNGAYLPDEFKHHKRGVSIVDLRGNIRGTEFNDIVVIPPPDDEARQHMLPYLAEEIDPHHAAYATTVDVSTGYGTDRNIVISNGGDIYAKGATFFYRGDLPRRGDMIYLDMTNVNKPQEDKNHKIFVHIGDDDPGQVVIANGDDIPEEGYQEEMEERFGLEGEAAEDADPKEVLDAANDDWFDVPNATFGADANDLPDGLGSISDDSGGVREQFDEAFKDAYEKLNSDVIKKDPLSEEFFSEEIDWDLPAAVKIEDEQYDAFFEEWEFFTDQEEDMSLETLQNE